MIRHRCDGCGRRFLLCTELDPFLCVDCSAILCPLCAEDGCCRAVLPGPACADCFGYGLLDIPGECWSCDGLGVVERNGLARECPTCGGSTWLTASLCGACGGYGHPQARGVNRRSA